MRLSYSYDINTCQISIDGPLGSQEAAISSDEGLAVSCRLPRQNRTREHFTFGAASKRLQLRYWNRELIRRCAFYDDLGEYITSNLAEYSPVPDLTPIPDYPISVDWSLEHNERNLYRFRSERQR